MFLKNKFTFLVALAVLSASSISAGSVRGLVGEDGATTNHGWGRELKKEQEQNRNPVVPVPTAPVPPPAPVAPPTPRGAELWESLCSTQQFTSCLLRNNARSQTCSQCLYATSLLSTTSNSGVNSCGKFMCGGCVDEANAFFNCGTGRTAPTPVAPVPSPVSNAVPVTVISPATSPVSVPVTSPVTSPVSVPVVPAPVEAFAFTFDGCPAVKPTSGDVCVVPAPFDFQRCDYPTGNGFADRCTCAYGQFICNPAPITPTPRPVAAPTAPTPPGTAGPGVCSATLPRSGDSCGTGGLPFVTCCYNVDTLNGRPAPADFALVCNCLEGEGRYICNQGTTAQCGSIINPNNPVPAPTPVVTPINPVPAPTPVVILAPTSPSQIPEFCQALDGVPQDGESCVGVLPAGTTSGGCGGEIITTDSITGVVTVENAACSCMAANPVWMCVSITLPSVGMGECPPQASPPNSGDSCVTVLPPQSALTSVQCRYTQSFRDTTGVVTDSEKICACARSTGVFSCTGEIAPVPDTLPEVAAPVPEAMPSDSTGSDPVP